MLSVDIFGERSRDDPTVQAVPMVPVWLELEEHVKADSIPSPEELFKEVEMMEMYVDGFPSISSSRPNLLAVSSTQRWSVRPQRMISTYKPPPSAPVLLWEAFLPMTGRVWIATSVA